MCLFVFPPTHTEHLTVSPPKLPTWALAPVCSYSYFLPRTLKPPVCALVADERWKMYNNVAIHVAMLQEVHASEGSDSVAVVDYAKMWLLSGTFLAAGDQVR